MMPSEVNSEGILYEAQTDHRSIKLHKKQGLSVFRDKEPLPFTHISAENFSTHETNFLLQLLCNKVFIILHSLFSQMILMKASARESIDLNDKRKHGI